MARQAAGRSRGNRPRPPHFPVPKAPRSTLVGRGIRAGADARTRAPPPWPLRSASALGANGRCLPFRPRR
jgi:hypothetical protein